MTPRLRVIDNPPNPWQSTHTEWLGEPPKLELEVFEENARSIIAKNDSPDVGFDYSVNPYRGCYHGCAYCYARPSHQYLDLGAGTDFERRLVVRPDAPRLLTEAFEKKSWQGALIAFSGNTDCYQPLEASYRLTRACLEVCAEYQNPVSLITKATLIERDVDVLKRLPYAPINISIPFFDPDTARAIEPYVPTPKRRLETVRRLADAGLRVGVMLAPIIPGLNDADAPKILEEARKAGAQHYGTILVRLPREVNTVFEERLRATLPLRAERVLHAIEACRGGRRSDPRFSHRMTGSGERWQAIQQLIGKTASRLGYTRAPAAPDPSPFRRPHRGTQLSLFSS